MPYAATKPADPIKAILRERDLATLKKRFLGECLLRLQTLEGQVEKYSSRLENYKESLALLERRVERLSKFQKELWKRQRYLGKTPF